MSVEGKGSFTTHVLPSTSRNTTRLISFMEMIKFEREQRFLIYGQKINRVNFSDVDSDIEFIQGDFLSFLASAKYFFKAEKIVVHGFFNINLMIFFKFFPQLLNKVYWVVWGGDLYTTLEPAENFGSSVKKCFKKSILKKVDNIVTYIPGDFELVRAFLNQRATLFTSLMYPGNLYKGFPEHTNNSHAPKAASECRILVGNSGSPSNNHSRIFKRLTKNRFSSQIKVYCPLSYGDPEYIKEVCALGSKCFGQNFVPLTEYMGLSDYISLLSTVKYAVFDYDRQQGMGNIISLLGLGKGVFLNPTTTPWHFFKEEGVEVLDVNELENFEIIHDFSSNNPQKVREKFSSEVLRGQLYDIFN